MTLASTRRSITLYFSRYFNNTSFQLICGIYFFSSEAPGLKDQNLVDSIQERIQCALEEYDKYNYSHYQPFRFGRLLLRLPKLKQTVSSPVSLQWLQQSFFPSLHLNSHKSFELFIEELIEKELYSNKSSLSLRHNHNMLNTGEYSHNSHSLLSLPFSLPSLSSLSSSPLSSEKLENSSIPLFNCHTDYLNKFSSGLFLPKHSMSKPFPSTTHIDSSIYNREHRNNNEFLHLIHNSPQRDSTLFSNLIKSTPKNDHCTDRIIETMNHGNQNDDTIYSSINRITTESSPSSSSSLSSLSSSSSSLNPSKLNLNHHHHHQTSMESFNRTMSSFPLNNIEHIESNHEFNHLYKDYTELFTNDLFNLLLINKKNSNLQIYYSLLRKHLNSLHNCTS